MNITQFEEELKALQQSKPGIVVQWLERMADLCRENKVLQDFLSNQHIIWEILIDRVLSSLYKNLGQYQQNKAFFLESIQMIYRIVLQLTKTSRPNIFEKIAGNETLYSVPIQYLPPQIQLLLSDDQVQIQNPYFSTFLQTFNENIQIGKNQRQSKISDFRLNSYLILWVHLLRCVSSFRDGPQVQDILKLVPQANQQFIQLFYNPYLAIIRRLLLQHYQGLNTGLRNQELQILGKIIILIQEYTVYQSLFQLEPNELKLSQIQMQQMQRLRKAPYIGDGQLYVIFLMMLFNCNYGQRVDLLYQQYLQIYKKQIIQNKYFQITFEQALFRILFMGLNTFGQDKQCNGITMTSYVQVWLLFTRQPFAKYEHKILDFAEYFDSILINFLDRLREHQKEMIYIDSLRSKPIIPRIRKYLLNRFGQFDRWYKLNMLKKSLPYKMIETPTRNYSEELRSHQQDFEAYFRQYYPFYTALFNRFMEGFSQITYYQKDELQALIQLVEFACSGSKDKLYMDELRYQNNDGNLTQLPSYQELRSVCENLQGMNCFGAQYQVFGNKQIGDNVKRILIQLNNSDVVNKLEYIYDLTGNEMIGEQIRQSNIRRQKSRLTIPLQIKKKQLFEQQKLKLMGYSSKRQ